MPRTPHSADRTPADREPADRTPAERESAEPAEPSEPAPAGRLCVPVRPGAHGVTARLFRTPVGFRTAVAFTTPERLRATLGAAHPWIPLSEPALRALARPLGVRALTVDPVLTAPFARADGTLPALAPTPALAPAPTPPSPPASAPSPAAPVPPSPGARCARRFDATARGKAA
ncbi:SAV_915 family protein [Streptomyces omiyaensis]|uniref:SAV_915 family protein n=1 Tax=Streptomyces omiyaensis TaxID=68247 RepID=UPI0037020F68